MEMSDDVAKANGSFQRNAWYCAALKHELGRELLARTFLNEPVVMYRTATGLPIALEDRCCHRRAPLSKGMLEGDQLRCGYHGFLFDPTGKAVWIPGQPKVPPQARVRSYPIIEKHGFVWIWMGDPGLADPATAPAFAWNDDQAWASSTNYIPFKCNYLLAVDNLLDLSHVGVLHVKTIGSADDSNAQLDWERGPTWVRGTRIGRNLSPSEREKANGVDFPVDYRKTMEYTPPANVTIEILVNESGKTWGEGRYNYRQILFDTITPESDTTCHFFYGRCFRTQEELANYMSRSFFAVSREDQDMLEAQQRIISLDPRARQVNITGDAGGIQARRVVAALLAAEQSNGKVAL